MKKVDSLNRGKGEFEVFWKLNGSTMFLCR